LVWRHNPAPARGKGSHLVLLLGGLQKPHHSRQSLTQFQSRRGSSPGGGAYSPKVGHLEFVFMRAVTPMFAAARCRASAAPSPLRRDSRSG